MTAPLILRVSVNTPLRRLFDYLPPDGMQAIDLTRLKQGIRLLVPFQSRTLVAVLIEVAKETSVPYGKLKKAVQILDEEPVVTEDVYKLCTWAADYYHYSLGEILHNALPTLIRKGHANIKSAPKENKKKAIEIKQTPASLNLNDAQRHALTQIVDAKRTFRTFLLDGVTGSGKTEVYLRAIDEIIKQNQQVLVLVPEISLTPQTIQRFRERFDVDVALMHSGLGEKKRLLSFQNAADGTAKIVIGTRSAIFTSFKNLGLIIVDEEHDTSFKQQDRFRYHARDLAIMRANHLNIPVVLGSATPSLESLLNVKRKRYELLSLPERAGNALLPTFQMIDLKKAEIEEGISTTLLSHIKTHLEAGNQVMLFLNRRGFAPVLYCSDCSHIAECKRCDARMVYHRKPERLHCHHCDTKKPIPEICEACGKKTLQPIGIGTQRIEQILTTHFPTVPIIRIDRDSTRKKDALRELIEKVHAEPKAILLGTQMLAKGHHFPQVTLVGIIDADSGLFSIDFRAAEQMGQLLIQVAGRAGRAEKKGTVMIQTKHPNHPLLQTLIQEGYQPFAQTLLEEREQSLMPPFSYFAIFRAEAYVENAASQFLEKIKKMSGSLTDAVTVLGPVPALMSKRKGLHCQQLLVRANRRSALQSFLKGLVLQIEKLSGKHPVKWGLDVDPVEI